MSKKKKLALYITLLFLGLTIFILQVFVFEKPDGILGVVLCLICIYVIFGSMIKLCKISEKFKNLIIATLDILFWIP